MIPRKLSLSETKSETKSTAQDKIAALLLDIDGCMFYDSKEIPADKPIEEWLIERNKAFLDKMLEILSSDKYKKVVIGFFTKRQSFYTDKCNRIPCTPVLPILQSYLQSKLKCEVVLDPFWMADIYSNEKNGGIKQAGDSYKLALKERDVKLAKSQENHSAEVNDEPKLSLLYAHAHRAAHFHPNTEIDIFPVDDCEDILRQNHTTYSTYTQLLPKSATVNFIQYNGKNNGNNFRMPVRGTGEVDDKYDWGVRYLMSACNIQTYETAAELKEMHEKNNFPNELTGRNITSIGIFLRRSSEIPESLKAFRETEYSKLKSTLGESSNYTTAEALYKEGRIPKSFIVGVPASIPAPASIQVLIPTPTPTTPVPHPEEGLAQSIYSFSGNFLTVRKPNSLKESVKKNVYNRFSS